MFGFQTREVRFALRELAILSLAAVASFLFINHEVLYLSGPLRLNDVRLESYLLATIVIYLFLRLVIIAAEMRPPKVHEDLVRCPECGQWLDDPTAAGREAHHRIELTPKPSENEIVSAVGLRKAVDAVRLATKASDVAAAKRAEIPSTGLENVSGKDLLAALEDPDLLERLRHSPHPPPDPRLKR